jgi:hypothetical protein
MRFSHDTFAIPPEQIIVSVFSVPDGSRPGSFLSRKPNISAHQQIPVYRTPIEGEDFLPGTFMLNAEDPLSGATNRQMISTPPHREVKSEFLKKSEHEQVFTLTSLRDWRISSRCPFGHGETINLKHSSYCGGPADETLFGISALFK